MALVSVSSTLESVCAELADELQIKATMNSELNNLFSKLNFGTTMLMLWPAFMILFVRIQVGDIPIK